MPDTFKCAHCGGVFEKGQDNDAAVAEYKKYFGQSASLEDAAIVCEDCFEVMHPEKHPHLVEEAVAYDAKRRGERGER